jgi:Zn-dependent protease with chaperone function
MSFVKTWLVPRIGFWLMWTAWLCCLQFLLLERVQGAAALLVILGPPVLITWVGTRLVRNPFDSPGPLFWKGAAVSCVLTVFVKILWVRPIDPWIQVLFVALLFCVYMAARGSSVKRMEVKQGDLFARTQAIARQAGVAVNRVLVFTTPRNAPAAFANRTGAILVSDSLLRHLSRQETDAVIAHEAGHLTSFQRGALSAISMAGVGIVILHFFWPGMMISAAFWPISFVLLWRALRRFLEYDADASAIKITDPEALITALTRVSHAGGLPMHWGWLPGIFMAHPSMTVRFRAIARRAEIASSRVEELMANAIATPPLPGYDSPFASAAAVEPTALSIHAARLQKLMAALSKGFPILAGIGASAAAIRWQPEALVAFSVAWILGAVAIYYVVYEVLVGSERRRLRRQFTGEGYFVGIATADEPRYYEGLYHYDLGMARFDGGSLVFQGARSAFSLNAAQVKRVWLADGPRHWLPRKMVCIEYENEGGTAIVSMQSMERWFWPATSRTANRLLAAIQHWSENAPASDAPTILPPQLTGYRVPRVRFAATLKSMRMPCIISYAVGWVAMTYSLPGGAISAETLFQPFLAPLVTGALILFAFLPHLEWGPSAPVARVEPNRAGQ